MYLPNEVHDLVISDLGYNDRKNYRLIGNSFAHGAIPHIFNKVDFSYKISSLRNLARIASQEHLSRHVKHLKWTSNRYGDEIKEAEIGFGAEKWKAVRSILPRDAQDSEAHADTGMRILTLILRHLPNLNTLHIDIRDTPGPTERRLDPSDASSMIRGEYEMYTLLNAAHVAGCPITEFSLNSGYRMHPLFRTNIWPSISPICADLTSLSLPVSFAIGTSEKKRYPNERDEEENERTEGGLIISAEFATVFSDHSTAVQTASLQTFLGTLTHLRTLKLNCKAEQWDEDWRNEMSVHKDLRGPLLKDILPRHAFPNLHTLQLDAPSTSTAYLKTFLTQHKDTLEVVKLSGVRFAICGAEDYEDRYPDEGCAPLKRFMESEIELEEWELTCENCGCNLWDCCREMGGSCC